ncbi:hypothetical protein R1flu_002283 [Riccia fluitans]|uniref:Uncharacterized protein n=1 Tax=Riccia fluitans TaxID=41844 RepID=A0ABD1Y5M8_9MARC
MASLQLEQICTGCLALHQRDASRNLSWSRKLWTNLGFDRRNPGSRNLHVTCSFPRTYRDLAKGVGLEELIRSSTETEQGSRREKGSRNKLQRISDSDAAKQTDNSRPAETNRGRNASPSTSSSSTSDLDCEHFSRCSGCVIDEALDKPQVMGDAINFFKRNGIEDMALTTCGVWEWRCRAKLAVRGTEENPLIGLYEEGSHDVVDIPNCRAHHPRINEAVSLVKEAIKALGVQPYNEETQTGQLRLLANFQAFEALLRRLQKKVKRGSAVVELYAGVGVIGLSLAVTRACRSVKCVEVNKEAKDSFQLSLARVPASVDCKISWHCADASVSPIYWLEGADVVIVDPPRKGLDSSVVEALRVASFRGQGKQKPPSLTNTSKVEKRPWIVRAKQDSVVKENGLSLSEDLDSIWPDTLIYVSCGWESFKRDCAALTEGDAWHLDDGHAFNFFPGTDSIETLAVFKRGKRTATKSPKKKSGTRTGPIPFHRKVSKGALPKSKQ